MLIQINDLEKLADTPNNYPNSDRVFRLNSFRRFRPALEKLAMVRNVARNLCWLRGAQILKTRPQVTKLFMPDL